MLRNYPSQGAVCVCVPGQGSSGVLFPIPLPETFPGTLHEKMKF